MKLSKKQIIKLRSDAHPLKPVVMIGGQSLTPAVHQEIDIALTAHELIKIKVLYHEKEDLNALVPAISETHKASHIQTIGHILIFWRKNPNK